jgi:hypothetical protein
MLTAAFAILSLLLLIKLYRPTQLGTYETDFETTPVSEPGQDVPCLQNIDLLSAVFPSPIPLQKVRFRGSPHFYNNGSPWADPPDTAASWPENLQ